MLNVLSYTYIIDDRDVFEMPRGYSHIEFESVEVLNPSGIQVTYTEETLYITWYVMEVYKDASHLDNFDIVGSNTRQSIP